MGRGFSVTRAGSARPILKQKRKRSLSMGKLKAQLMAASAGIEVQQDGEAPTTLEGDHAPRTVRRPLARGTKRAVSSTPAPSSRASSAASNRAGQQAPGGSASSNVQTKKAGALVDLRDLNDEELEASEDEDERIAVPEVLTKYKLAGQILDAALDSLCSAAVAGAGTKELCASGNADLSKRLAGVYKNAKNESGGKIKRGIAYPTNISVNNVLCNHAPFANDEGQKLKSADVVKIHLGCHIDGYPVQAARTIIVGEEVRELKDSAIHAIQAAHYALEGAIHMLRPGEENGNITDYMHHVGRHFGVEAIEGVLSNRTKRWIPDGMSAIICRRVVREDPQQDVAPVLVGMNEVWTLDVAYTDAPSYKMQLSDEATNIFRRNEVTESTRLAACDYVLKEVKDNFHCFPFHPSQAKEQLKAKLGINALKKVQMLDIFPALRCKGNFTTTRCCCTVAVTDKKIHVLCGSPALPQFLRDHPDAFTPPGDVINEVLGRPLTLQAEGEREKKRRRLEE